MCVKSEFNLEERTSILRHCRNATAKRSGIPLEACERRLVFIHLYSPWDKSVMVVRLFRGSLLKNYHVQHFQNLTRKYYDSYKHFLFHDFLCKMHRLLAICLSTSWQPKRIYPTEVRNNCVTWLNTRVKQLNRNCLQ